MLRATLATLLATAAAALAAAQQAVVAGQQAADKAAADLNAAERILPLGQIAGAILAHVGCGRP